MKFTATFEIIEKRVEDLLCCGMESKPYNDFVIAGYDPVELVDKCTYPHIEMPFRGGAILMVDKYGDSPTIYRLDRKALQRGLDVMSKESMKPNKTNHMGNFLNENEDVITGTVFIQCALLGEIVYG